MELKFALGAFDLFTSYWLAVNVTCELLCLWPSKSWSPPVSFVRVIVSLFSLSPLPNCPDKELFRRTLNLWPKPTLLLVLLMILCWLCSGPVTMLGRRLLGALIVCSDSCNYGRPISGRPLGIAVLPRLCLTSDSYNWPAWGYEYSSEVIFFCLTPPEVYSCRCYWNSVGRIAASYVSVNRVYSSAAVSIFRSSSSRCFKYANYFSFIMFLISWMVDCIYWLNWNLSKLVSCASDSDFPPDYNLISGSELLTTLFFLFSLLGRLLL